MPQTASIGKGDEIKMWPVSALDSKKKKKKGTLGIGNASLFFASESDKTPVQKISVLHIASHSLEKGKTLHLESPLTLVCRNLRSTSTPAPKTLPTRSSRRSKRAKPMH